MNNSGSNEEGNERLLAEQRIAEQAALLDAAYDAIYVKDLDDRIVYWNKGAERVYGWTSDEVMGRRPLDLFPNGESEYRSAVRKLMENGEWHGEVTKFSKQGNPLVMAVRWTLVRHSDGKPKSILAINTDITERKKYETQFLRAQRLESIGTLAGGIAHDLNNILAPIIMSLELLTTKVSDEEGLALLGTMQSCANRGADLVRQVLTFARGVEGKRLPVNLSHLGRDIEKIVGEAFPKNIECLLKYDRDLWLITGDPTQLHQVLMNLCVNARDAMPHGGKLQITMQNMELDEVYANMNPGCQNGPHVMVMVEDNGSGIPSSIRDKVFEPFFTTKALGSGTGLGLSTCSAIVKSHGGFINLYSEMGRGTRFKLYFPALSETAPDASPPTTQDKIPRGNGELVLLVDDEESIRNVAAKTLERFGYQVLTAANGAEGVSIYAINQARIAVVLTDMAMPIMDGQAMIVALQSINPEVRIIGSSGLSSNGGLTKAAGVGVRHFISKPYSAEVMLRTLEQALQTGV